MIKLHVLERLYSQNLYASYDRENCNGAKYISNEWDAEEEYPAHDK